MDIKNNGKDITILILIIVTSFSMGMNAHFLLEKKEEPRVYINSLYDGQEVHSVVVIGASITPGNYTYKVYINGEYKSNTIPYYWNNINEPAGNYSIVVYIYNSNGTIIANDSTVIEIPAYFEVPLDYEFTEDFVVHKNQTVVFKDGDYYVAYEGDMNGYDGIDNKIYLSVNNFGNIILDNAKLYTTWFISEGNSTVTMKGSSRISGYKTEVYYAPNKKKYEISGIRFNDNAILYITDGTTFYLEHATYIDQYKDSYGQIYSFLEDSELIYENT